ncbi:MAG: dihydropteroate synthase [Desulfobulbaceae bacterium]|nr:dihydropteroate synthase [Desulfobulbaceae bacterium]
MKLTFRNHNLDLSSRVHIMGILNVTPDSFSDGGQFTSEKAVLQAAERMITDGADIIDIGGESTRPYAQPVPVAEELRRVIPAISALRQRHSIPISIDTSKAEVAERALDAGADIINDISAMRFDTAMVDLAAKRQCPVVIMHMQGTPADMQIRPKYTDVISETIDFFKERLQSLVSQGINRQKIILDPGIGFGKTLGHNLAILNRAAEYQTLACPILIGHSRKSFLATLLGQSLIDRDLPTAIISGLLAQRQVAILRVHDVLGTAQALRLSEAIAQAR